MSPRAGVPHFKVLFSIQNHRKMLGVYEDDALLAMYVRAGVMALERYADRTGGRCFLANRDLERIAQTSPFPNACKRLDRLVAATPLEIRCRCAGTPLEARCGCAGWELEFPNLSKKQFPKREHDPARGGSASASASASLKPPVSPAARGKSERQEVRRMWPGCQDAAAHYGKEWKELTKSRLDRMAARLLERPGVGAIVLVNVIHGAVSSWGGMEPSSNGSFDPKRALTPETVYRASNFTKYLEAYSEPERRAGGMTEEEIRKAQDDYKRGTR